MSFVHLHTHTHYSILNALGSPKEFLKEAKALGMPALAITDSSVMYGAVEFYKYAKELGIKPIIGMEVAVAPLGRSNKTPENRSDTLVLLAKNLKGYQNLLILCTLAALEGFYYRPRLDDELLEKYSEGIIALSGSLSGAIPRSILENQEEKAREYIERYQTFFGKENFFLELQHHPEIANWSIVNQALMKLGKDCNAPLVAANDCHYIHKEDAEAHDVLVCIRLQKSIHDTHRLKFLGDYSLRSIEELKEAFSFCPEAIENTLKIADLCDLEIEFGNLQMPVFPTEEKDPQTYLRELCEKGLKKRYGPKPTKEAMDRLDFELSIIEKMGFSTYFLIVHDFIHFAKSQGIVVGPGRGSAAGSIIAYVLGITELDPLQYGLLFERFLNPERISMPDIDVDFTDIRRDEVLEYVTKKYGEDRVAQIITFGTLTAKAAVRDAGRALGYSYSDVDKIAKTIPAPILGKHAPLAESTVEDAELSYLYKNDPNAREVLDMAIKLEGTVRQVGTHACAVIISKDPLAEHTPLQKATGEKAGLITQYSMKPCEDLGLLKMDFLGLKNLSILETTLNILKERYPDLELNLGDLNMEDQKTFELLQRGETTGVFQLESAGMKRYLKDLRPNNFGDIIAMVSLYRPGPMQFISVYIEGKHGKKKIEYFHESLKEILEETYGIAIYQEQILKIAQHFAGYTLGQADLLRRAIGKKIASELIAQREQFISGAKDLGHTYELAVKIFDEIVEPFAGYGFNKSHAACYALIAYQTAYLKAHFPAEFMAALLTSDSDQTDRIVIEIEECRSIGIQVLPPDINESNANFTVVSSEIIRFGLCAIKGIGAAAVQEIITAREKEGPFKSLEDFAERVPARLLNKKSIESLAYSGALDIFGDRATLAANFEEIAQYAKNVQKSRQDGQMDLFGNAIIENSSTLQLKSVPPLSKWQSLRAEKEYLGLYVSGHPLQGMEKVFKTKGQLLRDFQDEKRDKWVGKKVKVTGLLSKLRRVMTKSGQYMAFGELEDPTGKIPFTIFPRNYEDCGLKLEEEKVVQLEGRLSLRDENLQIIVEQVNSLSMERLLEKKEQNISLEDLIILTLSSSERSHLPEIKKILEANKGNKKAEIRIEGDSKEVITVPFGIKESEELFSELSKFVAVSRPSY